MHCTLAERLQRCTGVQRGTPKHIMLGRCLSTVHGGKVTMVVTNTRPGPITLFQGDGPLVRATVQGLSGSAGPSGFDAKGWKRVCSSFHSTSDDFAQPLQEQLEDCVCPTLTLKESLH